MADETIVVNDPVNHPSHYNFGEIEVIDYIRDKLTPEEFTGYCVGNTLKYISRWRHKGGLEDLEKAKVYLNWAIGNVQKQKMSEEQFEQALKQARIDEN